MCLSSLLSATIIYTEALLHCKWRKLEPRGKKKKKKNRKKKKADKAVERMTELRRHIERERERESHLCPILWWAKCLQLCAGAANQKDL